MASTTCACLCVCAAQYLSINSIAVTMEITTLHLCSLFTLHQWSDQLRSVRLFLPFGATDVCVHVCVRALRYQELGWRQKCVTQRSMTDGPSTIP